MLSQPMKRIYVVGTADTKGEELSYLKELIVEAGGEPLVVDVGIRKPAILPDISAREVAAYHLGGADELFASDDRGTAVAAMGAAFAKFIASRNDVAAVLGIGGGGGTSIVTAGMRALPVGLPKIMVSTLASGEVSSFVGVSDIAMMPSITDMAGLNRVSRAVLRNAAFAIAGMARAGEPAPSDKPAIGLTMFGVTTPCVTQVVAELRNDYDCVVFHATGTGGRAMEKLVDNRFLSGVIDATTTEVADLIVGGVMSAGEDRIGAIERRKVPYVASLGALDMVNFWALDTVPAKYRDRNLYQHNPQVTLLRTNAEENRKIGQWLGERLNRCEGPVRVLVPELGVSALDAPGKPFHDPKADAALFDTLEDVLEATAERRLIRLPLHINDPAFSAALAENFRAIARQGETRWHT
jgi:uncharacterized protein (UPF0261 family)